MRKMSVVGGVLAAAAAGSLMFGGTALAGGGGSHGDGGAGGSASSSCLVSIGNLSIAAILGLTSGDGNSCNALGGSGGTGID